MQQQVYAHYMVPEADSRTGLIPGRSWDDFLPTEKGLEFARSVRIVPNRRQHVCRSLFLQTL